MKNNKNSNWGVISSPCVVLILLGFCLSGCIGNAEKYLSQEELVYIESSRDIQQDILDILNYSDPCNVDSSMSIEKSQRNLYARHESSNTSFAR